MTRLSIRPTVIRAGPWAHLGVAALIIAAIWIAYANSVNGPFVFDDLASIPANPTLRDLGDLGAVFSPPGQGVTVTGRPWLNASFAVNYAISGLSPRSYHLVNIAIHTMAALLLFGVVRRTLLRPLLAPRFGAAALPLSGTIAVLWALQPLQTESVTYVVQRAESLMGCCYLFTLYAFIRSLDPGRPRVWQIAGWLGCLAGMATKEVMISAPLMIVLYDRILGAGSWADVWRQRSHVHGAFAATWLLLAALVLHADSRGGTSGLGVPVRALDYWATQPAAIVHYLSLALWPNPLVFDYGTPWREGTAPLLAAGAMAAIVLGLGGWLLWKGRPTALLVVWFFAILAPTSVVPGARQTMAEHRMYLALAPVLIALVLSGYRWLRIGPAPWLALAGAVALLTATRNRDYRSELRLWNDTVAKAPTNPWARDNLGKALADAGRHRDALAQHQTAIRLRPYDPKSHFGAGNAWMALQHYANAIAEYREALRHDPAYLEARVNLGIALYTDRQFDAAAQTFAEAIRQHSDRADLHAFLGNALVRTGAMSDAERELRRALELNPRLADAAYNLGALYLQQQKWAEAREALNRSVQVDPHQARTHAALGISFAQLGQLPEAIIAFKAAVRLNPNDPKLHENLAALYHAQGDVGAAESEFATAARTKQSPGDRAR